MATHSSILAWGFPWTEEPGWLQSKGSQRVGHDWENNTHTHIHTHIHIKVESYHWFIFDYVFVFTSFLFLTFIKLLINILFFLYWDFFLSLFEKTVCMGIDEYNAETISTFWYHKVDVVMVHFTVMNIKSYIK